MARRIPLSFKENQEEIEIFQEINKHSCKAAFIKEALKFYIDYMKRDGRPRVSDTTEEEIKGEDRDEILNILG